MLLWFDVNTTKHALLFTAIGRELEKHGYKYIITARDYDAIVGALKRLNQDYILVGRYGGKTLAGKLKASLEKALEITEYFMENDLIPDVAIHFSSPEAARIAFGLKIKSISLNDSPHSYYPLKLSLPLTDILLIPKAIPKECFAEFISVDRIYQFNGIDVLEWIYKIKPNRKILDELGLEESQYIVFRPEESFASYYGLYADEYIRSLGFKILNWLTKEYPNLKIVFLSRYKNQIEMVKNKLKSTDNIIFPKKPILGLDLYNESIAVITGGSTMAIEASLLGVPAITYFPNLLHVVEYLRIKGFPIFHEINLKKIKNALKVLIKEPELARLDTSGMTRDMEKPSLRLREILTSI